MFFTETDRAGKRRIISAFPMLAGWNDRIMPSPSRDGFVAAKGATNPGFAKGSEWETWIKAAATAGVPEKLMGGSFKKLVGMEVVLGDVTVPDVRRRKSVDPDEKPREPRSVQAIVEVVTLPSENKEYKGLTDKEIEAYLEGLREKSAARRAARGDEDESPEEDASEETAEEEETEEEEEESEEEETSDDDDSDDSSEEPEEESEEESSDETSEEEAEEEEAPKAKAVKGPSPEAKKAATAAVKKALTGKKMGADVLLQKVHPLLTNLDKKVRAEALKLVQSAGFLQGIGVKINNNKVSL